MSIDKIFNEFNESYTVKILGGEVGVATWFNGNERLMSVRYIYRGGLLNMYDITVFPAGRKKKLTVKLIRFLKDREISFRVESVCNEGLFNVCVDQRLRKVEDTIGDGSYILSSTDGCYGTFEYIV